MLLKLINVCYYCSYYYYLPIQLREQNVRYAECRNVKQVNEYKLLCPRGTQTCALAVANIKVNGNGKVILDTHPESDQHQN